jgi:hypothetical protein
MQLVGHGTISVFACSEWEGLRMSLGQRITGPKFETITSQIKRSDHCHPSCNSVGIGDSFFGDLAAGARSWILPYVSKPNDIMNEKMILPIDVLLILFGVVVPSTFRKNVSPFRVEACKTGIFLRNFYNTIHFKQCEITTRSILTIYHRETLKSVYSEICGHLDQRVNVFVSVLFTDESQSWIIPSACVKGNTRISFSFVAFAAVTIPGFFSGIEACLEI